MARLNHSILVEGSFNNIVWMTRTRRCVFTTELLTPVNCLPSTSLFLVHMATTCIEYFRAAPAVCTYFLIVQVQINVGKSASKGLRIIV